MNLIGALVIHLNFGLNSPGLLCSGEMENGEVGVNRENISLDFKMVGEEDIDFHSDNSLIHQSGSPCLCAHPHREQ